MTYTNSCDACMVVFDWYAPRFTTPDPVCRACGGETRRLISAPAVIWTRALSDYGDKTKETHRKDIKSGGHWTYEKNSQQALDAGRPLPIFIDSQAKQDAYCRREKLINPKDLPGNLNVNKSGTGYEKANLGEV